MRTIVTVDGPAAGPLPVAELLEGQLTHRARPADEDAPAWLLFTSAPPAGPQISRQVLVVDERPRNTVGKTLERELRAGSHPARRAPLTPGSPPRSVA